MILRNDDAPWGMTLGEFQKFCNICDKYKVKILQAITPIGDCHFLDASWDNQRIIRECGRTLPPYETIEYLASRKDMIAVHGLYHTHCPSVRDVSAAKTILNSWGLKPTHIVWPFNEASTDEDEFCGLKVIGKTQRIEDYLPGKPLWGQKPTDEFVYLHSWRWSKGWYSWEALDLCLQRITATTA